jgi:hypothetical protein
MWAVMPANRVGRVHGIGCTELALEPWQCRIALDLHPDRFLRGLIHSDRCRVTNNITHRLTNGTKEYSYPRYFFCNEGRHSVAVHTGLYLSRDRGSGTRKRTRSLWLNAKALRSSTRSSERNDECPGWDSNPHWIGFEPTLSAGWSTGADHSGCHGGFSDPSSDRQGAWSPCNGRLNRARIGSCARRRNECRRSGVGASTSSLPSVTFGQERAEVRPAHSW